MKILFKNANILFADGTSMKNAFLTVNGKKIDKISINLHSII